MSTVDTALAGRIQSLYDATTAGWVDVWGEHLHHGYYEAGRPADHLAAQVEMIERLLAWGNEPAVGPVHRILDAGCGVGGSSRHLARRFEATVDGLTLSPVQRDIAERRSRDEPRVQFRVEDATATIAADGSYDLVWALESAEHMPDKRAFLNEAARLLRPGGRLLGATWCHRPEPPALTSKEERRLNRISNAYGASLTWVPVDHYREAFSDLPFDSVRTDDWSEAVKPFWGAVLRSALTPKGLVALASGGRPMVRGALGGLDMRRGIATGLVRYVVFTAVRRPR